jgi:hypothetical protein
MDRGRRKGEIKNLEEWVGKNIHKKREEKLIMK